MPGFLSRYQGTSRIIISPPVDDDPVEYWTEIKKVLSHGEDEVAEKAGMVWKMVPDPKNPERQKTDVTINPQARLFEQVMASMVGWNLTDVDGTTLPLDYDPTLEETRRTAGMANWQSPRRKSLIAIPQPVYDLIAGEVGKANNQPTREEARQFRPGGGLGNQNGQDPAPDGTEVLPGTELVEVHGAPA